MARINSILPIYELNYIYIDYLDPMYNYNSLIRTNRYYRNLIQNNKVYN